MIELIFLGNLRDPFLGLISELVSVLLLLIVQSLHLRQKQKQKEPKLSLDLFQGGITG